MFEGGDNMEIGFAALDRTWDPAGFVLEPVTRSRASVWEKRVWLGQIGRVVLARAEGGPRKRGHTTGLDSRPISATVDGAVFPMNRLTCRCREAGHCECCREMRDDTRSVWCPACGESVCAASVQNRSRTGLQ
jgi:hypothetical protein